jgi:hypothetical protein
MKYGVIRQFGDLCPFVFAMTETRERAESICKNQERINVVRNSRYWTVPIKDNACTGDDLLDVVIS